MARISMAGIWLTAAACIALASCAHPAPAADAAKAGAGGASDAADAKTPWWKAETALGEGGALSLAGKPWWPKARALEPGERMMLRSALPGGGRMLVRRERPTVRGKKVDRIVWILDDDGDMPADAADGDADSDCTVVDYGADGTVDRMVDYLDDDGDDDPDEMDIRYFHGGRLRIAWFGLDLDDDSRMWSLADYQYDTNFFESDPYGDSLIFANRYDPERSRWGPISECPFAFCDTDGDGFSEAVVRFSAVPLGFDPVKERDPGNALFRPSMPFQARMRHIGVVNVRYGIDLDGLSGAERPLHYDLGFNMIGALPYRFPGMEHANPLRRPPETVVCVPHGAARGVAETYPAEATGFSFREYADDTVTLGYGPRADKDRRWEGVFWIWRRRIMHNTGGPTQTWNMRREYRPTDSTKRELYYCLSDRRIHLKGAAEGWLQAGHLGGGPAWGEIRTFDTDGDGVLDRWEVYRAGSAVPARVATVRGAAVRDLPADWTELGRIYTKEILPEAIRADRALIDAMRPLVPDYATPAFLEKAVADADDDTERRYALDLVREDLYLALLPRLRAATPKKDDRETGTWERAVRVSRLDAAYGEGRFDEAARLLGRWLEEYGPLGAER